MGIVEFVVDPLLNFYAYLLLYSGVPVKGQYRFNAYKEKFPEHSIDPKLKAGFVEAFTAYFHDVITKIICDYPLLDREWLLEDVPGHFVRFLKANFEKFNPIWEKGSKEISEIRDQMEQRWREKEPEFFKRAKQLVVTDWQPEKVRVYLVDILGYRGERRLSLSAGPLTVDSTIIVTGAPDAEFALGVLVHELIHLYTGFIFPLGRELGLSESQLIVVSETYTSLLHEDLLKHLAITIPAEQWPRWQEEGDIQRAEKMGYRDFFVKVRKEWYNDMVGRTPSEPLKDYIKRKILENRELLNKSRWGEYLL